MTRSLESFSLPQDTHSLIQSCSCSERCCCSLSVLKLYVSKLFFIYLSFTDESEAKGGTRTSIDTQEEKSEKRIKSNESESLASKTRFRCSFLLNSKLQKECLSTNCNRVLMSLTKIEFREMSLSQAFCCSFLVFHHRTPLDCQIDFFSRLLCSQSSILFSRQRRGLILHHCSFLQT